MYMSGYENLKLVANLYKNVDKKRIDEIVKLVGLENRIKDKVSKYSLGMRQRLGIAQAILHRPKLLILDEPTNGLDPEGIKEVKVLLKKLAKQENMAILISSHNLAELDTFCNKISIIKNGEIVETNDIYTFKKDIKNNCYILEVEDSSVIGSIIDYKMDILTETEVRVYIEKEKVPLLIKELVLRNIKIYNAEGKQVDIPIGSEITLNGNTCTIVNGTTQCKFLDNCTDSGTSYNFDFKMDMKNVLEQNQLLAGNYKIKFAYAFAQNDLLNGNIAGWIDVPLTIIDYSDNYGIDVSIDNSENLAEDKLQLITKGKEEVRIIHTNCSGQLENPFVKVSVVEKTSDFDYSATENSKKITVNDNGDGSYKVAFSDSLDVGTYRVIFELFDKYGNKMSENFANFIVVDKPNI